MDEAGFRTWYREKDWKVLPGTLYLKHWSVYNLSPCMFCHFSSSISPMHLEASLVTQTKKFVQMFPTGESWTWPTVIDLSPVPVSEDFVKYTDFVLPLFVDLSGFHCYSSAVQACVCFGRGWITSETLTFAPCFLSGVWSSRTIFTFGKLWGESCWLRYNDSTNKRLGPEMWGILNSSPC